MRETFGYISIPFWIIEHRLASAVHRIIFHRLESEKLVNFFKILKFELNVNTLLVEAIWSESP